MSSRPEPTVWVATGPNGEQIEVRHYDGRTPYYHLRLRGESVQCASAEDGITIIAKRAQFAELLTEMCGTFGLVPDASRNAGRRGAVKRDLAFGDLILTITRNKNSFYSGWITNVNEPRSSFWTLNDVVIDEMFAQARTALINEMQAHAKRCVTDALAACVKVGMSKENARGCIRAELDLLKDQD